MNIGCVSINIPMKSKNIIAIEEKRAQNFAKHILSTKYAFAVSFARKTPLSTKICFVGHFAGTFLLGGVGCLATPCRDSYHRAPGMLHLVALKSLPLACQGTFHGRLMIGKPL